MEQFDRDAILTTPTAMPDRKASAEAEAYLASCMKQKDSCGGVIECRIDGVPAGIGEPVFDKLDASLAKAVMSIGAVKAFEIGDGIKVAHMHGSENNDSFCIKDGKIIKETNHSGGILGGISDGSQILLRAYVKPTPSIVQTQHTVNNAGEEIDIQIKGRHDPVIMPRAVVVVEAMTAPTILDLVFENMSSRMDKIIDFYK